jgi:hypothetical protein
VLVTRRADPLVMAMIGHEIARRAGLESCVCSEGPHSWTALLDEENCTLVGSSQAVLGDARECGFRVVCAHETAVLLLERLASRAHGRTARCAAALACAIRCGTDEVGHCPGHARRA